MPGKALLFAHTGNIFTTYSSFDSVLLFFNPELGFSVRAWDPLSPGLNHIQVRRSFQELLESRKVQTGPFRKLSMRTLDCIASIRELLDPMTGLERKMSRIPSSPLLYALLEDIGELTSTDRAWNFTKTDLELKMNDKSAKKELSPKEKGLPDSLPQGDRKAGSLLQVSCDISQIINLTIFFAQSHNNKVSKSSQSIGLKEGTGRIDDTNPVFDKWLKTQGLKVPNFVHLQAKV